RRGRRDPDAHRGAGPQPPHAARRRGLAPGRGQRDRPRHRAVPDAPRPVVHRRAGGDDQRLTGRARRPPQAAAGRRCHPDRAVPTRRGTVTFLTPLSVLFALFTLTPVAWLLINSTKTYANIFHAARVRGDIASTG